MKNFLGAFGLLLIVLLGIAALGKACFGADFPTPASPLPPGLLAKQSWSVNEQLFDARTGELVGDPVALKCNADSDYLNGILAKPEDCLSNGFYRTAAECSKAEMGRISKARRIGNRLVATLWYCLHVETVSGV